jgi:hypothetical protein
MVTAEDFFRQIPKITKYICGFSFVLTLLSNFGIVKQFNYLLINEYIFSTDLQVILILIVSYGD